MVTLFLKDILLDGKPSDITISDGLISRIRPAGAELPPEGAEITPCSGKVAMPAFVNMHTHAAMTLLRGMQEDVLFHRWIENIWDMESRLDADVIYQGTRVAALEMIRTGTATFNDQYWYAMDAHRAAAEMGVRPAISFVFLDLGKEEEAARQRDICERMYEESRSWTDGALFTVSCHAVYTVSEPVFLWAKDFCRKHGLRLHVHVSETRKEVADCQAAHGGLSPVEYLDRLGILDDKTIAAHCLWLSDKDVEILGSRRVNCVHNVNSNLKIASGLRFRYNELRDAGANVCIGTDGCASSNNLDMLEAMKTSAIVQKGWREDPTALPLGELLAAATVNGARALGLNSGRIAEGALADVLIIDPESSFFLSPAPFLSNFVYSAHSDCIDSVIAGGRFVMKSRQIDHEKEILRAARGVFGKILGRS